MFGRGDPSTLINRCYSDGSSEIVAAVRYFNIPSDVSSPYRPQNNVVAERAVQTVVHGTRTVLEQAHAPLEWWIYAVRHFSWSYNIVERNGNCPYRRRFGKDFAGPIIPFGARVNFLPDGPLNERRSKWATRTMIGVFLCYEVGSQGDWSKHVFVLPWERFREREIAFPRQSCCQRVRIEPGKSSLKASSSYSRCVASHCSLLRMHQVVWSRWIS
jgi:hypothetical protein